MLMTSNLIKTFNVKDILFRAATVTESMSSGSWKVCNLTKPLKDIFKKLWGLRLTLSREVKPIPHFLEVYFI